MTKRDNASQSKQFSIYLRSTNEWIPVTKEQYKEHSKFYGSFRKKKQDHCKCTCPHQKWWFCNADCETCKYRTGGDTVSFDFMYFNVETAGITPLEFLESNVNDFTIDVDNKLISIEIIHYIQDVAPFILSVASMRLKGLTDTEIAKKLGIPRTTLLARANKTADLIREKFPDYNV